MSRLVALVFFLTGSLALAQVPMVRKSPPRDETPPAARARQKARTEKNTQEARTRYTGTTAHLVRSRPGVQTSISDEGALVINGPITQSRSRAHESAKHDTPDEAGWTAAQEAVYRWAQRDLVPKERRAAFQFVLDQAGVSHNGWYALARDAEFLPSGRWTWIVEVEPKVFDLRVNTVIGLSRRTIERWDYDPRAKPAKQFRLLDIKIDGKPRFTAVGERAAKSVSPTPPPSAPLRAGTPPGEQPTAAPPPAGSASPPPRPPK